MDHAGVQEMRVELIELLRTREVRHPSRIVLLDSKCDQEVRIEVTGYPWWLESPQPVVDANITFHIEGITDGFLDAEEFQADFGEEDLETFDARPLCEHDWASGVDCEVYCSNPLSNPLEIHARVHDFLLSVDCPYRPERYLNMGHSGSLNEFAAIASSNSFLLCRGPQAVCRVACDVLETRGTAFNVVTGKDLSGGLISVRLGGSHLICRSAYAVFET